MISTNTNNLIKTFTFLATSLFAIWNETLQEKYNYFQRHQHNIIYFRCTIAFWISSIIFGIGTSVYFYNNIGHRKRRDRESMFSNCIEQDSPVRTSSPVVQQGEINSVFENQIQILKTKIFHFNINIFIIYTQNKEKLNKVDIIVIR